MVKPHARTQDQIAEMESEGQAQTHPPSAQSDGATDQDIDTARSEAVTVRLVIPSPTEQPASQKLEIPGRKGIKKHPGKTVH